MSITVPATVAGSRPAGALATAVHLAPLFARRRDGDRLATALPVAAFGVVTALLLVVLGGAQAFFQWDDELASTYATLAVIAVVLLLVPLATVGASAARLAARRRDERLASLRLLGATTGTITALTVLEAAVTALLGAVLGVVLYAVLAPLVGLLHFRGEALGAQMWVPWWWLPLAVLGVALLAAASAVVGLRAVVVTPLGVRTRQRPGTAHWVRVVIAVGVLVVGLGLMQVLGVLGEMGGIVAIVGTLAAIFGGMLLALDALGPWFVRVRARRQARKAQTVPRLLAARMVLEDPKVAWRQVSGVAMTSFVGVFGAVGLAMADMTSTEGMDPDERWLMQDISTGVLVTVAVSFLMVACSVGINQAASTLDRAAVHVSLDRLGVPRAVMAEASRRAVMSALWMVAGGSALCAAVLLFPLVGMAIFIQPVAIVTALAVFALGFLAVRGAAALSARLVPGILARPERAL
ncbi:FtsX-like permease family protein [Krasilnikoviella flava]|uniref:FtsX-like permease family protein n=1 Tax=Krasilnikoviella flava TaxID=526729 RepID=A0A1T5LFH7_9MICO|nr:FtsX-like permease family protein [Krasilnikoviella flava]SKC74752.1 FtsX-like permease family protein [Krasilnikoviella flava]